MARLNQFIHSLLVYDYILFGAVFLLFLLFVILGIILRHRLGIALFFIIFGFVTLFAGSFFGYKELHEYLFSNKITLVEQKKLTYSNALVIYGNIENSSKRDFDSCRIISTIYRADKLEIKELLFRLKPLRKVSIVTKKIQKGDSEDFKIIVEPFAYKKEYFITLKADCK